MTCGSTFIVVSWTSQSSEHTGFAQSHLWNLNLFKCCPDICISFPSVSISPCPVQHTSASQSSWVWSALLKVMLTVWVEGGDSMSPSFPALGLSSLPGDLNWWLSSFKSILKTTAAAVTLQNAEVGYKTDCDRLIWTAETRAFSRHHHHCLIISWFQHTTNWKRQQLGS